MSDLVEQLSRDGDFGEAASVLLKQGNMCAAMEYFLKAGMPDQAAQVWTSVPVSCMTAPSHA